MLFLAEAVSKEGIVGILVALGVICLAIAVGTLISKKRTQCPHCRTRLVIDGTGGLYYVCKNEKCHHGYRILA